jgi:hypothetical protein
MERSRSRLRRRVSVSGGMSGPGGRRLRGRPTIAVWSA